MSLLTIQVSTFYGELIFPALKMFRLAQLIIFVLAILAAQFFASVDSLSKDKKSTNIPEIYKPFLSGIGSFRVGRGRCTAFCVASNVIATSQHCLKNSDGRWNSSSLKFRFKVEHNEKIYQSRNFGESLNERRANIAFGLLDKPSRSNIATKRNLKRLDADWALIKLKQHICFTVLPVKYFSDLPFRTHESGQSATQISAEKFSSRSVGKRWTYSGKCRFIGPSIKISDGAVFNDCYTIKGMSGSPIFIQDDEGRLVVAAIVSGFRYIREKRTGEKLKLNRAFTVRELAKALPLFIAYDRILDPAKLRKIQAKLKEQNLYLGNVDGQFGPNTRFSIILYETSIGLPEMGLPTTAIYDFLKQNIKVPQNTY